MLFLIQKNPEAGRSGSIGPPATVQPLCGGTERLSLVGLCMLRVKYDLKSGLKFVQETRIFIAPDDEEILVESDEQQQRSWPTLPQTVLAQGAGQWPSTTCREESPQPLGGTGKAELTWPCWVSQTPSLDSRDTGSVLDPLLYLIPF